MPVVVHDQHGREVGDLKMEDFQVFDNGKLRAVSGFSVTRRAGTEPAKRSEVQSGAPQLPPQRYIVLLFDDFHLSFENLVYAKKAAAHAIEEALAGSNLAAVVSTSGIVNSGFTRDPSRLREAMTNLRPQCLYSKDTPGCLNSASPDSPRTQVDQGECSLAGGRVTPRAAAEASQRSGASAAEDLRVQDVRRTFRSIADVVRAAAVLPGQRTLVLVFPGFPSDGPEVKPFESQLIDLAARSNVSINSLDARGLVVDSFPSPTDILSELSYGTGGNFFQHSNDLETGFKGLTEALELVYVLELSLDGVKTDGGYHRLKVKLDRVHLDLQSRRGYFMPEPAKSKK